VGEKTQAIILRLLYWKGQPRYTSCEMVTAERVDATKKLFTAPDGRHVAYVSGAIGKNSRGVSSRDLDIYSLLPATRSVQQVTKSSNKGTAATSRNNPIWSSDSSWIAFTAYDNSPSPRGSTCSGLVNSDIFLIKADGLTTAAQITNTNGTSVEVRPKWGW